MKMNVLLLLSSLIANACGQKSGPESEYYWHVDTGASGVRDPIAAAHQMVDRARVTCNDSAHCSPSVGLLAFAAGTNVGMCTTFVIAADTLLTNSHCVEKHPDYIQATFPDTQGYATEVLSIDSVTKASPIDGSSQSTLGKQPDYAILKVRGLTARPALALDPSGVPDGTRLRSISIEPQSKIEIIGSLIEQDCESVMNSGFQPGYTTPTAPVVAIAGCVVDHGNSGSPLVDSAGKVRAIVHAGLEAESKAQISKALEVDHIDPLSLATNVACVSITGAEILPPECTAIVRADLVDGLRLVSKRTFEDPKVQKEILDKINVEAWGWRSRKPGELRWKLDFLKDRFATVPDCVLRTATNEGLYQENLYTWKISGKFDPRLRVHVTVTPSYHNPVVVAFSVQELRQNKTTQVMIRPTEPGNDSLIASLSLGYCANQ